MPIGKGKLFKLARHEEEQEPCDFITVKGYHASTGSWKNIKQKSWTFPDARENLIPTVKPKTRVSPSFSNKNMFTAYERKAITTNNITKASDGKNYKQDDDIKNFNDKCMSRQWLAESSFSSVWNSPKKFPSVTIIGPPNSSSNGNNQQKTPVKPRTLQPLLAEQKIKIAYKCKLSTGRDCKRNDEIRKSNEQMMNRLLNAKSSLASVRTSRSGSTVIGGAFGGGHRRPDVVKTNTRLAPIGNPKTQSFSYKNSTFLSDSTSAYEQNVSLLPSLEMIRECCEVSNRGLFEKQVTADGTRKHANVQCDEVLPEVLDASPPLTLNGTTQTDFAPCELQQSHRPIDIEVRSKPGVDATTQVNKCDLIDFETAVFPEAELLVARELEIAAVSVFYEDEIAASRREQAMYERKRLEKINWIKRMELEEGIKRKQAQRELELAERAAPGPTYRILHARALAREYMSGLQDDALGQLLAAGYFKSIKNQLADRIQAGIRDQHQRRTNANACIDSMIYDTIVNRTGALQPTNPANEDQNVTSKRKEKNTNYNIALNYQCNN